MTMVTIATVSVALPSKPETTAAAIRMRTMVLVNCCQRMRSGCFPPRSISSFVPCSTNRFRASASLSPLRVSVDR